MRRLCCDKFLDEKKEVMKNRLYEIQKDACKKIKHAEEEDMDILLEAEVNLLKLAEMSERRGLICLEEIVKTMGSDYLEWLTLLVVDAIESVRMVELGADEYWMRDPQGIWAMAYYFYLRGMANINSNFYQGRLRYIFESLIPVEWRVEYNRRLENMADSILRWRPLRDRELVRKFYNTYPIYKNAELCEEFHKLEQDIMERLDGRSLERIFGGIYPGDCAYLLSGICAEARKKVLTHISDGYGYLVMDNVIRGHREMEEELEEKILKKIKRTILDYQMKGLGILQRGEEL